MEKKVVYTITYWEGDKVIDKTRVDELNTDLIWRLFKEFGHARTENTTFEVQETFED